MLPVSQTGPACPCRQLWMVYQMCDAIVWVVFVCEEFLHFFVVVSQSNKLSLFLSIVIAHLCDTLYSCANL